MPICLQLSHLLRRQRLGFRWRSSQRTLALIRRYNVEDIGRLKRLVILHVIDKVLTARLQQCIIEAPLITHGSDNLATRDTASG